MISTGPMAPKESLAEDVTPEQLAVEPRHWIRRVLADIPLSLAVAWLLAMCLAALFANVLPLPEPYQANYERLAEGPSWSHPLGTDQLGRDLLSRVVYGARVSIVIGVLAVSVGLLVGGTLGMVAGYFRKGADGTIVMFADAVLAFPGLVLLLALTAIAGATFQNLVIALALLSIPPFIRLSRGYTLQYAQRPFVLAAISLGAQHRRVLVREIAPNVVPGLLAYAFLIVALVIVAEGSLSFLGLGLAPPSVSWGGMISSGRPRLSDAVHISLVPSIAMFFTVLSFNLVGERLQMRLEVRQSQL